MHAMFHKDTLPPPPPQDMWIPLCRTGGGGVRGGAVGLGTALRARRSRVRFPMVSLDFF